jgi:phenylalanyl-tRNA synthetase beta chain
VLAPLSWLRDYAPLERDVADLAATLSELGLVVEGVEHVGQGLSDVVVARVLRVRAHPDADRIRLVDVDAGDGRSLQIVCGAWNFAEGDLVPLAPVGAVLPGDFSITRRKMRGEWSDGMLCSAKELELPEAPGAADGLMILPAGLAPAGTPVVDALDLHPDVVFDLDISPNRSDALCMAGVARDLAAALGEPWAPPASGAAAGVAVAADPAMGVATVVVESGDLCPRFTATILEGVPSGPSPAWMGRRLALAGMRPINAIVDVSNYVMLDLGQPNHPYDLALLGGGGILVRRARPGETIETLDGVTRQLQGDDCLICDATGVPVGIGGIMGGAGTEIGPDTRRVLLEAAWFEPIAIAKTGKRLGLHSEARVRFERGVDPQVAPAAVERFAGLLGAMVGGRAGGAEGEVGGAHAGPVPAASLRRGPLLDVRDPRTLPEPPVVRVRTDRANAVLGTSIPHAEIKRLIAPIGFAATSVAEPGPDGEGGAYDVAVPSWRLECSREIDIVEEVARMWGYRRIARTIPSGAAAQAGSAGLTPYQRERRRIRQVLAGAGFDEAWATTFIAPGDLERARLDPVAVEVENPLDASESLLRTALVPGLLKAVKFNVDRQAANVCLFEIGHVFARPKRGSGQVTPEESEHLGVIIALGGAGAAGGVAGGDGPGGPLAAAAGSSGAAAEAAMRTWLWLSDALRLDGGSIQGAELPGFHPTRAARIVGAAGRALGAAGELDPDVVAAYGLSGRVGYMEVSLDDVASEPRRPKRAREVSRYPASDLDLAFVVADEVPATDVQSTIRAAGGDLLESVTLFDVYRGPQLGEGRRSLGFRLRFRAPDRTLTDTELVNLRQAIIHAVETRHGGTLRA